MWMKGRREVVWGRKEEGDFVWLSLDKPSVPLSTSGVIDWDHFTSRVQRVFFVILQICLAISNIAIFFSSSAGSCWPSNIALFFGFSGCGGRRRKKNKIMIYFRFPHRRIHPSLLAHHPSPSCRLDGFPSTRTAGSSYSKYLFLFFHFSFFGGIFLISLRQFAKLVSWFLLLFLCGQVFYLFDLIVVYHQQKTYSASRIPFLINSLS